jgi:hypothetical protein
LEFQRIIEENIPIMDKHYIYQEKYNIILIPVIICGLHIAMEEIIAGHQELIHENELVKVEAHTSWHHTFFAFEVRLCALAKCVHRAFCLCIHNNKDRNFKFIVSISSLECNFCTGYASSEADFYFFLFDIHKSLLRP